MRKILTKFVSDYWGALLALGIVASVWLLFGVRGTLYAVGGWLLTAIVFGLARLVVDGGCRALSWIAGRHRHAGPIDATSPSEGKRPIGPTLPFASRVRIAVALTTLAAIAVIPFDFVRHPTRLAVLAGLLVIFGAISGAFAQLLDGILRSLMDDGDEPPGHPPSDGSPLPTGRSPHHPKPLIARAKPGPG